MKLQHKTLGVTNFKALDEAQGIAEMIVSVFSNVDGAKERILPGFFTKSLSGRNPKGVWMHDWSQPVAKTLAAQELSPGDPRLPAEIANLGGLYVKAQFNLGTQRGKDAFSDLQFGTVDEFSIGYETTKAKYNTKDGVTDLIEGTLYEWSPVLVGCNPATVLIGTKSKYLGTFAEGEMTMGALNALAGTLFYDVMYDCIYGCWDWNDADDEYVFNPETVKTSAATLSGALDEFKSLTLSAFNALMAGTATDALDAAKSIKALWDDPANASETLPAGAKLADHSERALAAVEEFIARMDGLKSLRVKDARDISDAHKTRLKAMRSGMERATASLDALLASPDDAKAEELAALRLLALAHETDLNYLALN